MENIRNKMKLLKIDLKKALFLNMHEKLYDEMKEIATIGEYVLSDLRIMNYTLKQNFTVQYTYFDKSLKILNRRVAKLNEAKHKKTDLILYNKSLIFIIEKYKLEAENQSDRISMTLNKATDELIGICI